MTKRKTVRERVYVIESKDGLRAYLDFSQAMREMKPLVESMVIIGVVPAAKRERRKRK